MYRGNMTFRICKECRKQFQQELGTLAMKKISFLSCPYCGADSIPDEVKNAEKIQKQFDRMVKHREMIEEDNSQTDRANCRKDMFRDI